VIHTERARYYRAKIELAAQRVPEDMAVTVISLFPLWAADFDALVAAVGEDGVIRRGTRLRRGGYLFTNMHDISHADHNTDPLEDPSMWSRMVDPDEGAPEWFMPQWPFTQWMYGSRAMHDGVVWVSTADNNVWEPGSSGAPWRQENE